MTDEYTEQKIRVYQSKKKKEGGKFNRFILSPVEKLFGKKSDQERRLTA